MPSNHWLHAWQQAEARSACAYRAMFAKVRRAETVSAQELTELSELAVAAGTCQQRYLAWLKGQGDDKPAWLQAAIEAIEASEALAAAAEPTSLQGPLELELELGLGLGLGLERAPETAAELAREQERELLPMEGPQSTPELLSQQTCFKP